MVKLIRKYSVFLLLILLVFVRIKVRAMNPFWLDEVAEIKRLKSVEFVISELPTVPGGSPGHYLLTLPLQKFFPFNKYILGLPGLISHILVFLFIPKIISTLKIINKEKLFVSGIVARFLFAIDPTLTFQAMEVRPYSVLPLLWLVSFFIVVKLFRLDRQSFTARKLFTNIIRWLPILFLVFNWHFSALIMFLSIYIYMLLKERITISSFTLGKYSSIIILVSIFASLPVWSYFGKSISAFEFNTVATIPVTIMQIYSIDKGFPKGIIWQNWLYFFLLLIMLFIIVLELRKFFIRKSEFYSYNYFFKINIFLVIIPILVIFILDFVNRYGFWYRQFVWVMLPFYIANGVAISDMLKFIRRIRKKYA